MVWEFWDAFSNQGRGIVSPWYGWNNCHTGQVPIIISVCWEPSWGGWMCYIQCTLHLNNWAWREYCSYVECRLALLLEHMSWDHIWDCIRECRGPENLDKSNRFLNTQWKKIWNQRHEGAEMFPGAITRVVLYNSTAASALNTQCAHCAWPHGRGLKYLVPGSSLACVRRHNLFTVHIKVSGLNYRRQKSLVFPSC